MARSRPPSPLVLTPDERQFVILLRAFPRELRASLRRFLDAIIADLDADHPTPDPSGAAADD